MKAKIIDVGEAPAPARLSVTHTFALPGAILWTIGWLFTVGAAHLGFFGSAWAVIVWPYYLGQRLLG